MSWKNIVKAKGFADVKFDDKYDYEIAQEVAEDLNLVGEDNYKKRFYLSMDNFNVDIEVSNVEQRTHMRSHPSETFAIRVKPEGTIELNDNELDSVVKVFTEKDILIELDGTKPKPMENKSGAFLFNITYELGVYENKKLIIYVTI